MTSPEPRSARRDPTPWIVAALTLVALALRLPGALSWWFNPDEAIYQQVATADAAKAWRLVAGNAHPPLFYFLLRCIAVVNDTPIALRLPALLSGVALVPLTALLARRTFGRIAACVAALWVAIAPAAVMLSQVARPYMLQVACLCLAATGLVTWMGDRRARWLAVYTAAMAIALFVHYGTLVVLIGATVSVLLLFAMRQFDRRDANHLIRVHALLFAIAAWLYISHIAPRLQGSAMQAEARRGWLKPHFIGSLSDFGEAVVGAFNVAFCDRGAWALAAAALGCVAAWRARRTVSWLLPVSVFVCAVLLSLLELYPLGLVRHCAYLVPFAVVLAAGGGGWLMGSSNWLARIAGVALCVFITLGEIGGTRMLLRGMGGTGMVTEGVVAEADVRKFERFWRERLPAGAVILTDFQTLQLLAVLFDDEIGTFVSVDGARLSRLSLGGRALYFCGPAGDPTAKGPWILPWQRAELDEPSHLAHAIEAIESDPRLRAEMNEHGLWFVQGGWKGNLFHRDPYSRVEGMFHEAAGGPGLGIFRLHPPTYRAYLSGM